MTLSSLYVLINHLDASRYPIPYNEAQILVLMGAFHGRSYRDSYSRNIRNPN